jgi:hypothetical protein
VLFSEQFFYASCLRFFNKKLFFKFYERMLWHLSNRNPGGIKKRGIEDHNPLKTKGRLLYLTLIVLMWRIG